MKYILVLIAAGNFSLSVNGPPPFDAEATCVDAGKSWVAATAGTVLEGRASYLCVKIKPQAPLSATVPKGRLK